MKDKSDIKKITYQPYLFAISLLALLSKVTYSLSQGERISDGLLLVFAGVFIISSLLWYLDRRRDQELARQRIVDVSIKTGNVKDAEILGAETSTDQAKVCIDTKNIKGTKLTGFKETK